MSIVHPQFLKIVNFVFSTYRRPSSTGGTKYKYLFFLQVIHLCQEKLR